MAVPGRNQTLVHCIFRMLYRVWSAVAQNVRYLTSLSISPALNEVLCYSVMDTITHSKDATELIMFGFYLGLPQIVSFESTCFFVDVCPINIAASSLFHQSKYLINRCFDSYIYIQLSLSVYKTLKLQSQLLNTTTRNKSLWYIYRLLL